MYGSDIRHMRERKLTFDEAIGTDPDFNIVEKWRLNRVRRELFEQTIGANAIRVRLKCPTPKQLPSPRLRSLGQDLQFGEWADFYLETFSKPPFRARNTHAINQRALKHLRKTFETTKLADVTADSSFLTVRG